MKERAAKSRRSYNHTSAGTVVESRFTPHKQTLYT